MYWFNINTILFLILHFVTLVFCGLSELGNFCDVDDCGPSHIACNYVQGSKGPACPAVVSNFLLNTTMINLILKMHNDERDYIAKGRERRLKSASRMAAMAWNEGLYIMATVKALLCTTEPDPCHKTDLFKYSGQNLGQFDYPGEYGTVPLDQAVRKIIYKWLATDQNMTQKIVDRFPEELLDTPFDTYALIINERNSHIGCGIVKMKLEEQLHRILLVCDYATMNFANSTIYESGPTVSKCKTGVRRMGYFGLCSLREKYNYDPPKPEMPEMSDST